MRIRICFLIIFILAIAQTGEALVITSPKDGATFKAGDTVKLVAELSPGSQEDMDIGYVDFFFSKGFNPNCPKEISTHPRYECNFTIPKGSPQVIEISAVGTTVDSAIASPWIAIYVPLPSTVVLQKMKSFTGDRIYFFQLGQNKRLYIQGIYSDGVVREIWLAKTGTTYTCSNEKVVTVDADGLATAKGAGMAQITVKNGDKKLVLDAIVQPTP